MLTMTRGLQAKRVDACLGWQLAESFEDLDRTSDFACSLGWSRTASQTLGEDSFVHVAFENDEGLTVGYALLEIGNSRWRTGSPGLRCLSWPFAEIGYYFRPRWRSDQEDLPWLQALQERFPGWRLELSRSHLHCAPRSAPQNPLNSIRESVGTWTADVPATIDQYYATLRGKHRRDLRKYRRDIAAAGYRWITSGCDVVPLSRLLSESFDLHRERLSAKGVGSAYLRETNRQFLENLCRYFRDDGLRLTTLYDGERPIASCLSFVYRQRLECVMSGWDREYRRFDLGRQVIHDQILREFERGLQRIDLLGGDLPYKREFGLARRPTLQIVAHPSRGAKIRQRMVNGVLGWYRGAREYVLPRLASGAKP